MDFQFNDGGRSKYFKAESVGDCVVRAIAIASEKDYKEVYDELFKRMKSYKKTKHRSPRNGIKKKVYHDYLTKELGMKWTPTMFIGSGCKVHLGDVGLPKGRIICKVSKHLVALVDGTINDTYDCSRFGSRCVYGYYSKDYKPEEVYVDEKKEKNNLLHKIFYLKAQASDLNSEADSLGQEFTDKYTPFIIGQKIKVNDCGTVWNTKIKSIIFDEHSGLPAFSKLQVVLYDDEDLRFVTQNRNCLFITRKFQIVDK